MDRSKIVVWLVVWLNAETAPSSGKNNTDPQGVHAQATETGTAEERRLLNVLLFSVYLGGKKSLRS